MSNKKQNQTYVEQQFDLPPEIEDEAFEVSIPENPTLDDIVQLALDAYKRQLEENTFGSSKNAARNWEVAQSYLNLAKDTIVKKEDLDIKRNKDIKDPEDKDSENKGSGKITRSQMVRSVK